MLVTLIHQVGDFTQVPFGATNCMSLAIDNFTAAAITLLGFGANVRVAHKRYLYPWPR